MPTFNPTGAMNITLFAVEISDQGNVGRAVRIVFDLRNASRNAGFIAFEIDDAVMALVASAAAADRNASVVIAA